MGYEKFEVQELAQFERKLNRKIQMFSDDLKKYPKELKESIINGVKLYGWIRL